MFILQLNLPDFDDYDLSSVSKFIWAGSAAPREMVDRLSKLESALLITGYGLTEATGFVSFTNPEDDLETLVSTIGAVDPAWQLRLCDENRNEVAPGEVGEIAIRGDTVMTEYWNNPAATRETIDQDGWLYTGDLATIDERGYLTLVGRSKEMYKSGGFNVYPREIEMAIEELPAVKMVCVLPKEDPVFQEVGRAFVVLKDGESLTETELKNHCRERLADYKVPKEYVFRTELPMLGVGKIDKTKLAGEG
jgi:acyl-CoA synthetase (AMP-forming)/AMP-acid ligase II